MSNFKKLIVWQKSIEFVNDIYNTVANFPKEELFGLTSQLKRCSVSIPSNIAEGSSYRSPKEYERFINIAIGSAFETETQLIISLNQKFIAEEKFNELNDKIIEIQKMLTSFKNKIS
jgi:four helix bundle protein